MAEEEASGGWVGTDSGLLRRYEWGEAGGRVQLMSDIDLYIVCQHQRKDPFYQHILFMRNKLAATPPEITVDFQSKKSHTLAGTAVHELLTR